MTAPSPDTSPSSRVLASPAAERRRRWETFLPREDIAAMLQAGEWLELLFRLREARLHWPSDLELLRSVRVLEHYLSSDPPRNAG